MRSARWGKARIEVNALRAELSGHLEAKVPLKQVYEALKKAGRVTVAYSAFHHWVRRIEKEDQESCVTTKTGAFLLPRRGAVSVGRPAPGPDPIADRARAEAGGDQGSRVIAPETKGLVIVEGTEAVLWGDKSEEGGRR